MNIYIYGSAVWYSLYKQSLILSDLASDFLSNKHHHYKRTKFLSNMEVESLNLGINTQEYKKMWKASFLFNKMIEELSCWAL